MTHHQSVAKTVQIQSWQLLLPVYENLLCFTPVLAVPWWLGVWQIWTNSTVDNVSSGLWQLTLFLRQHHRFPGGAECRKCRQLPQWTMSHRVCDNCHCFYANVSGFLLVQSVANVDNSHSGQCLIGSATIDIVSTPTSAVSCWCRVLQMSTTSTVDNVPSDLWQWHSNSIKPFLTCLWHWL